jgi:8-oxo-dGTP pyrophosphatase MutT (NUDIX family)
LTDPEAQPDPNAETNPWRTLSRREVYRNPWIAVREDEVIRPDGHPGIYGVVEFIHCAVGVLAVESDGSIWLVGQYRYPTESYSWEVPEGGCAPGESELEAAVRELREETGLTASRIELLAVSHLSNSVTNEKAVIFRATGLDTGPRSPEGTERLQVRRVPFDEAFEEMKRGAITDSMTVIALLHEALRRRTTREDGS